jgi:hypothetical protein
MADIKVTDNADLSADLNIRDDSPLAKAKLTQLVITGKELLDDFSKPIDQADVECPATFVPVEMRQTGMIGTGYDTREEAYGGADRESAATG